LPKKQELYVAVQDDQSKTPLEASGFQPLEDVIKYHQSRMADAK
jgi:hypothetical protein